MSSERKAVVREQTVDLHGAFIRRANLRRAILRNANFAGADAKNADFREADFENANLEGTILVGADLTGAINLNEQQLNAAIVDETTKLPDYIDKTRLRMKAQEAR